MNFNDEYSTKVKNIRKRKNSNNSTTTSSNHTTNTNNNNSLFVQIPWGNVLLYYTPKVSLETFLSLRSTCTGIPFDLSIQYHIIPWIYTLLVQSNILLIPDSISNWKYSSLTNTTTTNTTTTAKTNSSSEILNTYQSIYNLLQKCRNQPLYDYINLLEQNDYECNNNRSIPLQDNDNSMINVNNVASKSYISSPIVSNANDISVTKLFFHIVRIIYSVPQQVAICFSGKYGRHCIPFQKDIHSITNSGYSDNDNDDYDDNNNNNSDHLDDDHETINRKLPLQLYPFCSDATKKRSNATCENCKFRIPTISKENVNNMDERFVKITVQTKNKLATTTKSPKKQIEYLNTDQYFPTCVPNIPIDLQCPICCYSSNTTTGSSTMTPTINNNNTTTTTKSTTSTTNRTLQLTEVSYKVDSELYKMFPYLMSLTFTPIIPVPKHNDNNNTTNSIVLSDNDSDRHSSSEEEEDDDEEEQRYQIERRKRLGLPTRNSTNNSSSPTIIDNNNSTVVDDSETTGQSNMYYKEFVTVQEEFFNPYYTSNKIIRTNIQSKNEYITTKHAIAIHCTKCYQFGLLAPATVCSSLNRYYYNNNKNRNNSSSSSTSGVYCQSIRTDPTTVTVPNDTLIKYKVNEQQQQQQQQQQQEEQEHVFTCGGVLVRTMCKNINCSRALECTMCRTMFFNNIQQQQQQQQQTKKKKRHQYNDISSSSRRAKRNNISATIGFDVGFCFACYTDKYL